MSREWEIRGLDEINQKMMAYPMIYVREVSQVLVSALLVLHENVPSYPPKPETSTYDRTGTLGRSLGIVSNDGKGSGMGGFGQPGIFRVKQIGGFNFQGEFGTNLKYAPRVIGSRDQQTAPFNAYWWRLEEVVQWGYGKILKLYQTFADKLAAFLDNQSQ